MSLLSFFNKNKQADAGDDSASNPRIEPASQAVRARKRKTAARDAGDGSGSAPVDPVLPEKKRARRRLVGAVALVLAVVIGLPMVLDSEPKPLADDVTIEIPSKDRPADGARRSGAAGSRVPAASALDRREEVVEMPGTPPAAKGSHAARADAGVSHAGANAANAASGASGAKARADAAAQATSTAAGKSDEAPVKDSADAADARPARFILQVAAFASMDKVNEVRGKLKGAGIASYTQKITTDEGERIRVRVGPFATRQEAERVRTKLGTLGLNGKLQAL